MKRVIAVWGLCIVTTVVCIAATVGTIVALNELVKAAPVLIGTAAAQVHAAYVKGAQ